MMPSNQALLFKFICCFILKQFLHTSFARHIHPPCQASSCGSIRNISYPFRLRDDPAHCGDHNYELACKDNVTMIYLDSLKYMVRAINYDNYTIRLADATIINDDVCSFGNVSLLGTRIFLGSRYYTIDRPEESAMPLPHILWRSISFISCPYSMNVSKFTPIDSCLQQNGSVDEHRKRHAYVKVGPLHGSDLGDMCRIDLILWTLSQLDNKTGVSLSEIHDHLVHGFELYWFPVFCGDSCPFCSMTERQCVRSCLVNLWCGRAPFSFALDYIVWVAELSGVYGVPANIGLRLLIGVPCLLVFLIYKCQRRHLSMFDAIETFLQSNNNLMPTRYSYSHIKRITKGFQEKLGEGGYGSVYKGKLRSGHDVAVKLLKKPRSNPHDFINEISTIGRIHHVNVVKLVGYCVEGSKCGLIYDYMINGSLDRYILSGDKSCSLSLKRRYEIAVGVARGIEYLHQGCNIRILHFDIKPHNILLDDKFTPKISDFGLAKFYSVERSMVTLTCARGTIGYVAPELMNRSIGNVSSKADVYSFGMLLLDMVGLKRDVEVKKGESSKYFPYWIYDCFERGTMDNEIGNVGEDDGEDEDSREITRKMTIVGLWCIQMSPSNRPSMNEVVKLLEGDGEKLQVPPHPSKSPLFAHHSDHMWEPESTDSVASSGDDSSHESN